MSSMVRPASATAASDGVERELEAGTVDLAADRGLADAGDDGAVLEVVAPSGGPTPPVRPTAKLGIEKPPGPGSKPTSTAVADGDLVDGRSPAAGPAIRTPG